MLSIKNLTRYRSTCIIHFVWLPGDMILIIPIFAGKYGPLSPIFTDLLIFGHL